MSSALKILVDARMVTRNIHGIARYTSNLIRGLAALGHRVSILSHAPDTPDLLGARNIADLVWCRAPFANPMEAIELSVKSRGPYDIVHFPSFAVPFSTPARTVVTIHDLIHLKPPAELLHKIYYETVVKKALRNSAAVITVSQWSKNDILQFVGISPEKIHVVRNGLESKWFRPEQIEDRAAIRGPFILCVSNPKPHKNVRTLMRACEILWSQGQNFELVLSLGGSGLPTGWLSEKYLSRVHLIKDLPEAEFIALYKSAEVLVSPALYEGFDLPAAEALALGTPVLLSAGTAHSEFRGTRLTFYEPAQNASKLAGALASLLKARRPSGEYSHNVPTLTQMVDETVAVYEEVLRQGSQDRSRHS